MVPEVLHHAILTGKVKEIEQELQSFVDLLSLHTKDPSEVHHGLLDGKFSVESNFLRHVPDSFTRHT